jgi:integrase
VGTTVRRIGKAANVVVQRSESGKVKYASAHDFRRSFGERWSICDMPKVLRELMRHRRIETTMRYYVGKNAEQTADVLRAAVEKPQEVSIDVSTTNSDAVAV